MQTPLFTGIAKQRPAINLSGQKIGQTNASDIKQARAAREQERQRIIAATKIQALYRQRQVSIAVAVQRGKEFDVLPIDRNTLLDSTALLTASHSYGSYVDPQTITRLGLWCRTVVTEKLLFEPFAEDLVTVKRWRTQTRLVATLLLLIIATSPSVPQVPLFIEVVRQLIDLARYPQGHQETANSLCSYLITHKDFYGAIQRHCLSIPIEKKASSPSLQPIIGLALAPFKTIESLQVVHHFLLQILTIDLLINRLPLSALTTLSSQLLSKAILLYAASPAHKLDLNQSQAVSLLANAMALFEPRIKSFGKIDELAGWLALLSVCISEISGSILVPAVDRKGKGKAKATNMDIDEPPSSSRSTQIDTRQAAQIAKVTGTPHLTQIIASSSHFASSPKSRPILAKFLLTLLTSLPTNSSGSHKRDDILTLLVYDRSAGSGLLREIWRGWIRSGELMRILSGSQGKEGWKDVVRLLQRPANEKQIQEWHLLILSVHLYTRTLLTLGDDEFYPSSKSKTSRNPLLLEEISAFSGLLRNIAFALYWSSESIEGISIPGIPNMAAEELRTMVRGFLVAIHERDCRRQFLPPDHFIMTDEFDVQSFVETAVLEDQRLDEAEDTSTSIDVSQHPDSDEDSDAQSRANLRHRPKAAPSTMSRRQIAFLSPRLGLLNNIPFVIPFETRVSVFRQLIYNDRQREANLSRVTSFDPFSRPRGQTATIRRGHVADDGFQLLHKLGGHGMKQRLQIQFVDEHGIEEAGIDGGGLFKEFLTELGKEAFDVNRGLWRSNQNQEVYPAPHLYAKESLSLQWFTFLGQIIGKALYEGILVSVPFAPFFLSKWLGKTSFFDDLQSLDPDLYHGLVYLKNHTGDVADLSLTFAVDEDDMGVARTVDLIPNGRDTPVTNANRFRYITLISHYRLNSQLRDQSAAFVAGLHDVVNPRWLRLFSQTELRVLVGGTEAPIDVDDLRINAVYGGIDETSETVRLFWDVLKEFTPDQRRAFVRFVTSADKAPLLGFKELNPNFAIRDGGADDSRLPSSSTCVNLLKLPRYRNRKLLKEKLLLAINAQAGFFLS